MRSIPRTLRFATAAVVAMTAGAVLAAAPASASAPVHAQAVIAPNAPQLGANVYVFNPRMAQADIQATVDAIANQQTGAEFGPGRYALLFEPGTYGSAQSPLEVRVGYYTEVAGLGAQPGDVQINGRVSVYNQCQVNGTGNCIALTNFWRSLSNLTINVAGGDGCRAATNFWAVSQAAPMRRVDVNGKLSLMDYCGDGPWYASGGFIADSRFRGEVVNGSQQQFLVRNSELSSWSNGVWNQVFAGTPGAPATSFGVPGAQPYTTLATTPVSMEEPYLSGSGGSFSVRVPPVRRDSSGPTRTNSGERVLGLSQFFVATPSTSVSQVNQALANGRHLLLSPGTYRYSEPIRVTRADTVVLGLGLPTITPQAGNAALTVDNVAGVKVHGLTVDAGPVRSPVLVQVGRSGTTCTCGGTTNPVVLQDLFVRVGGALEGKATTSLEVNAANVLLDDTWLWRGDHGTGIGWTRNTGDHGLVVNGADVTATGLFVEHFQKTETIWRGERGRVVMYQNERPYDPPSQAAWQEDSANPGYPALEVVPGVTTFRAWGLGSYSFFNQGVNIESRMSFRVPRTSGVRLTSLLTVFLNGSGAIRSVVNDTGPRADSSNGGSAQNVVSYP
ncbi:hypothetical protein [Actinokineospora bangkokensis]|uniref:Adenylyl cyclase n=1 Tax=Actinokineospora bangkokensis TaxID=1193682 RepID=A0A1Q9LJS8_9PSEU|nr:hypothetical protein [Actinokineospora bangkokensis]OLR92270.1 hypothetical protein BJP25_23435 [Actinokineospora bangkokensis]